ncbi:MAG: hypothetical protein KHX88_07280, partial [Firmicutes bacterium]|nr:hypothetical protein [Bacillota bacterium]
LQSKLDVFSDTSYLVLLCSSLFNLQGTRSNRGTNFRLPHLSDLVNTFFVFLQFFFTHDGGRKTVVGKPSAFREQVVS